MKKRLFLLIFSAIFVTSLIISLIIGRYSYNFVKSVLRESREEKISRIEKQLDHYQSILYSIEKEMNSAGESALFKLSRKYPSIRSMQRAGRREIRSFARQAGITDIYFIDSSGIVFNSSLETDIGLNLLGVSPAFTKYIKGIYGSGKVVSQGISVSINEGKVNHYMYYSPSGSNVMYEISIDASEYIYKKYNFALYEFLFRDMFENFYNRYLFSVDLYSITSNSGWSLINRGKKFSGPGNIIKKVIRDDEAFIENGDTIYYYKKMKFNKYFFNRTTKVYIELIYDVSILSDYIKKIVWCSALSGLFIIGAVFIVSSRGLNVLLLNRISNIIDGLKRLEQGDLSREIEDKTDDELSSIVNKINEMSRTILIRSDELKSSNKLLRDMTLYVNDIIESMPSALITIDENDLFIQWNREAEKLTGIPAETSRGKNLWNLVPELAVYREQCLEVRNNRVTFEGRRKMFSKNEQKIINLYIFPFSELHQSGVIIRVDDVTDFERKESQLERARKVEVLGTMAGGLAHDFNNIITGIVSSASYLEALIKNGDDLEISEMIFNLDIIKKSGLRASELVKNLKTVSSNKPAVKTDVNLDAIIRDVIDMAGTSHLSDIKVDYINDCGAVITSADRLQIEQVIPNLLVNAAEAIKSDENRPVPDGGITVVLEVSEIEENSRKAEGTKMCHISVADNGPGINPVIMKKIFDPFVSSKKTGSGLGLAVVNTIITYHGGSIEVISEPGEGTRFDIFLPLVG